MNEESSRLFATQKYIWNEPNNWTNSLPTSTYSRLKRAREQSYILIIYVPILFKLVVESRFAVDLVQTDVIAAIFYL